jgi:hypothetical protein
MSEVDYWESLEFRVCHALREMPERRFQSLWCDGFIPNEYQINTASPRIIGEVWICNGQKQSKWGFTLLLLILVMRLIVNVIDCVVGVINCGRGIRAPTNPLW